MSGAGLRKCILCHVPLTTSRKYYSIDKETGRRSASRRNLNIKLENFLGIDDVVPIAFRRGLAYGSGHLYICESCVILIEGWERAMEKKTSWLAKYDETTITTSFTTPSKTTSDGRMKRMASVTPQKQVKVSRSRLFEGTNSPPRPSSVATEEIAGLSPSLARMKLTSGHTAGKTPRHVPTATPTTNKVSTVEVIIHFPQKSRKYTVPEKFHTIGHAIGRGDETSVVKAVMNTCNTALQLNLKQKINTECSLLVSDKKSLFKRTDEDALKNWSSKEQEEEVQLLAPTLFNCIKAAACDESALQKATVKSYDTILPGMMASVGSLLFCRSSHANSHATMTAITLRRGGADSVTYTRLNHRGLCVSYDTVIRAQDMLAKNHDAKVLSWAEQIAQEHMMDIDPDSRHFGMQITGDNLDFETKARQSTSKYQGTSHHMFNVIVIKNRISPWHLADDHSVGDHTSISTKEFLPDVDDDKHLRHEMGILVGRIIAEHIPHLAFFKKHVPAHIQHEYSAEASKKSEVIPLGIIMQNENTKEGIEQIVKHLHRYTPGHNDPGKLVPIISSGDLLTCERECGALEVQRDQSTETARLEGLQPHIADFHTSGNYMQAIWDALWDSTCPGDHGALYPAKTRLKAKKVKPDPMQSYNPAEDFLHTYCKSLVVAAALQFFGMDNVLSEPTQHKFNFQQTDEATYVQTSLTEFVDAFLVPSIEDSMESVGHKFVCHICTKATTFVTMKGLKKHLTQKHPGAPTRSRQDISTDDNRRNYCCNAMSMSLIAMDFTDARKHGDGERLLRLYKFKLLHFMAAGKRKYAYQCFRLLAAQKCFMTPRMAHELKWNRFVNTTGKIDGNIEPDRENEHDNRNQKDNIKAFHGKITEKSVHRVSRSAPKIRDIMHNHDKDCGVREGSGKHTDKEEDTMKDVVALAEFYNKEKVFVYQPGKQFKGFPSFPRNYIASQVDMFQIQLWMRDTLHKLSLTNMFQRHR